MATLYKTHVPADFETGEFYQPSLTVERVGNDYVYFVREKHGWFSDTEKRIVHVTYTLAPEAGFKNIDDAPKVYNDQIRHRASEGFRHMFEFDPIAGLKYTQLP
jgi:trehalose utilization protein